MNQSNPATEHVPADHILDDFLAKHDVTLPILDFGAVLADLREAFYAEMRGDIRANVLSEVVDALDAKAATLGTTSTLKNGIEYAATVVYRMIPRDQLRRLASAAEGGSPV